MLSDILPTAFECGVLNGKIQPGDTVAIVGAGPIGLAALLTAQFSAPPEILMIDLDANRLRVAEQFGATALVNSSDGLAVDHVMALTNGAGVDVAIRQDRDSRTHGKRSRRRERRLQRAGREGIRYSEFVARVGREGVTRHQLLSHRTRQCRLHATFDVNQGQFPDLAFRVPRQFPSLEVEVGALGIRLRADRHVLAGRHGERARREASDAGHQDVNPRPMSGGHADDEARRRHDSVVGAEHRRAELPGSAGSMVFRLTHGLHDC